MSRSSPSKACAPFAALLAIGVLLLPSRAGADSSLTLEERVAAQEVIERAYYRHQAGRVKPFESVFPRHLLAARVREYLKLSVLLETRWGTPITAAALRAEWSRIRRGTRFPRRLEEIEEALGHDPAVIQECFVRPVLARRLARNFFAFDRALHGRERTEIDAIRAGIETGELDPSRPHPRQSRTLVRRIRVPLADEGTAPGVADRETVQMSPAEFARFRRSLPRRAGTAAPVQESRGHFSIDVLVRESADEIVVATYVVPKTTWDAFWIGIRDRLDEDRFRPAESGPDDTLAATGAIPDASRPGSEGETLDTFCVPDDTWDNGSLGAFPTPREQHTAVWTGSVMLVWGGILGGERFDSGSAYDPLTDTWSSMSPLGAPSARSGHVAVWTGEVMTVWGGLGATAHLQTGGRYDPVTDTWTPTSTIGAPSGRSRPVAVWSGNEMLIWGPGDGARYDPVSDTWAPISAAGAPSSRIGAVGVWDGSRMIVWGGAWETTGGRYDPGADTWSATSVIGAPAPRLAGTAVWTGSEMIVWGGSDGSYLGSGGRYDPVLDSWSPVSEQGAPAPRMEHVAAWVDDRMVVWGGRQDPSIYLETGGRYDPSSDTWTPTSTVNAPPGRESATAVSTGSRMIMWGGEPGYATGGRYDPVLDSWTPTATTTGPFPRWYSTGVWTGTQVIIWGGLASNEEFFGRYDPLTDSWMPVTSVGAPPPRYDHTAIWSGHEMIIWGGVASGLGLQDTGGRYDPLTDSWSQISSLNAPSARTGHSAVWANDRMIVWGGDVGPTKLGDGAIYRPGSDTWMPISLDNAPAPRTRHTAVWTGKEMIIWGGGEEFGTTNSGGRYDPLADSWTPTSTSNAPLRRVDHAAFWTGTHMLIWGQRTDQPGGLYEPVTDSWAPVTTLNDPVASGDSAAVWTGNRLIVWGGVDPVSGEEVRTGGVYDPQADVWLPTSTLGAPSARRFFTLTWTGDFAVLYGGNAVDGGRYALGQVSDFDGDGVSRCNGDCDDLNPAVHPGAVDVCDGFDNDCDGALLPGDEDADSDGVPLCAGDCDDDDGLRFPGRPEVCNGIDDDCDAVVPVEEEDGDGDGFRGCEGDCNDASAAQFPGNPEGCDGLDNDCDGTIDGFPTACGLGECSAVGTCVAGVDTCAAGTPAPEACDGLDNDCDGQVPPEESDGDGDGFRGCEGDCDDTSAAQFPGNPEGCDGLDNDCDGTIDGFPTACGLGECSAVGTCVAGIDTCAAGTPVPEACDGLDNDCDGAVPADESDGDGDGFLQCGDCDDGEPSIYPAAPEANDGVDNQCPGDPGAGLVDEVSGLSVLGDQTTVCWSPQTGAASYEAVVSNAPAGATECAAVQITGTCVSDPQVPPIGGMRSYLVRSLAPHTGSWGDTQERAAACGFEFDCGDGQDNDGDGLVDCDDFADCNDTPTCAATLTIADGVGDDVPSTAILDFFGALPVSASDYIHVRIAGSSIEDFEWCSERADFYRDRYLALAPTGGIDVSSGWALWYRLEGGSWVGPMPAASPNAYGDQCIGPYSWCPEMELGGRTVAINPADEGLCEIGDASYGCGDGTWVLAISVGAGRPATCGF